jgi:hypothetical protein
VFVFFWGGAAFKENELKNENSLDKLTRRLGDSLPKKALKTTCD